MLHLPVCDSTVLLFVCILTSCCHISYSNIPSVLSWESRLMRFFFSEAKKRANSADRHFLRRHRCRMELRQQYPTWQCVLMKYCTGQLFVGKRSNMAIFEGQLVLTNHLDGGGVGHADLLRVIGEEIRGGGRDLPGSGGGLSVEVSRLTCGSHKRDVILTCQSKNSCWQSDGT